VDLTINVLLVDDYVPVRRTLRDLLRQIGFRNIDDASDATTALAKLQDASFGLVISDWKMEPMSGLELLKRMRSDDKLKDTPFIMVTGTGAEDDVLAAKEAGVSSYIVKPFNLRTLRDKIEAVMTVTEIPKPEPDA